MRTFNNNETEVEDPYRNTTEHNKTPCNENLNANIIK